MPSKAPSKSGHSRKASKDTKPKKAASKDADEEMTVVVPPTKNAKNKDEKPGDADGDVAMGGSDEPAEPQVDPVEQVVTGALPLPIYI